MTIERNAEGFFAGKNIVVSGGSSGFGRKLVERLRCSGCKLIVASRTATLQEWIGPGLEIEPIDTDFASLRDVHTLSHKIRGSFDGVDILINNAGALNLTGELTSEGLEYNLAVNYLSHYALTTALADILMRKPGGLVVNIGSAAADQGRGCRFEDFVDAPQSSRAAYERSKWAISAFSFALDERFRELGSPARSILVRPPFMDTGIVRNNASQRWRSRLTLRILRGLGAFTDDGTVAESALGLLQSRSMGEKDYAIWSKRGRGFEWAERPSWANDRIETAALLSASETACGQVLGPWATEFGRLW